MGDEVNQDRLNQEIGIKQLRRVEELVNGYINWFENERKNEEEKLQQIWLERKKLNLCKDETFDFQCLISKQKIKFPVFWTFCIDQAQNNMTHFDQCFDLTQLIISITDVEGQINRTVSCPTCERKQNIPPNLSDILILQKFIRPHMLFYTLRSQIGIYPKAIVYIYPENRFFPKYKRELQENYWIPIKSILNVPQKQDAQFFAIANKLQDYQGSEFTNVCLISQVRVNIPVRGNQCVHYESYDLAYLFKHLKEKVETHRMKCVRPHCQSIFNLDDPTTFCVDYDLLKAGMKGLSFSINFTYNHIYHTLTDSLLNRQRDEQIEFYRHFDNPQKKLDYINKIYEFSESIFSNEQNNKSLTEKFLLKLLIHRNSIIKQPNSKIPSRCINCRDLNVCDLRLFACILHQVRNQQDQEGVFQTRLNCPLCNYQFKKSTRPPQTFFGQVYIDTEMMKFFIQTPFYQRTQERFQQFLNNRPSQNLDERRRQIETQLDQLKIEKYEWTRGMALYTLNFQCLLTGNRITIPVRNKNCEHYDCFDWKSLKSQFEKNPDLETYICPLPSCLKPFGSINNFFIDEDLFFIMQKPRTTQILNSGVINLLSREILQS